MFLLLLSSIWGATLPGCRVVCHTQIPEVPSPLILKTEKEGKKAISLKGEKGEMESQRVEKRFFCCLSEEGEHSLSLWGLESLYAPWATARRGPPGLRGGTELSACWVIAQLSS